MTKKTKDVLGVNIYGKIGTVGLVLLTIILTTLSIIGANTDKGLSIAVIWCLLIIIIKLDVLISRINK